MHGKNMYFSSAQLTTQHAKEEVNGKTVLAVANFPRKQIGPRMSDCLITGVQVDSDDVTTRTASTVLVECSHAVQAGLLVTVTGSAEKLDTNTRDLAWDTFTAAEVRVGTVIDAKPNDEHHEPDSCLSSYTATIDFGDCFGVKNAYDVLDRTVFASVQTLLHRQLLAITNLACDVDHSAHSAILSVGGMAVLQPAKQVANGYLLA